MSRLIERKVHWRPVLGTAVICKVTTPLLELRFPVATGYLLGTLHKVTCKNCLRMMKHDKNITSAMWKILDPVCTGCNSSNSHCICNKLVSGGVKDATTINSKS